jgi:hypothetical protein
MNIGIAIVLVAVMYFIDKHSLWRRFAMCLGVVAVLALLGLGGFWGWTTYRDAKWVAEIPACNSRNIKTYFAAKAASAPALPPGFELERSIPQSTMEEIKKRCSADPYKYVWSGWTVMDEGCIDGTNPPCTLTSDGHGNLVPIPKGKDDAKKASK